jgi:copper transport protein
MRNGRFWRFSLITVSIVLALLLAPSLPNSLAHPIYVKSTPEASQSVATSPHEVDVFFTEPIELKYSKISVVGPDGKTVDNNDPHNVGGDTASLGVSLKPNLPDGVYTVSTKVLSAVDGHVVDNAFTFGVGAGTKVSSGPATEQTQNLLSAPEAASRYPGMIGQVMIVGAAFATLWLWKPIGRVPWLSSAIAQKRVVIDKSMVKFVLIGVILVLASGAAMIVVQASSVGSSIPDAIATKFGNVWVTRMLQASILLAITLSIYRKIVRKNVSPSRSETLAIIVLGLAILVTSSLIAHAAATSQVGAIALDFFHDVAAAIWIGGLMLLGFVVAPRILEIADDKVKATAISLLIPRFSIIVVTILGIVAITGPLLLYSIESDLSLTLASIYGKLLIVKLSLAGIMLAMGAYSQFAIQKKAVSVVGGGGSGSTSMMQTRGPNLKHFGKFLKVEAAVGIGLLLMVSLMANSSVPSGQFPAYENQKQQLLTAATAVGGQTASSSSGQQQQPAIKTDFTQTAYVNDGQIQLAISPFDIGQNTFKISFIGKDGKPINGIDSTTIRMTQTDKGIGPITVDAKKQSDGVFTANPAFGVAGMWNIVIEGVKSQGSNMIATYDVNVKPHVSNLDFSIKQYNMSSQSLPLYPVFDTQRQSIWVGDTMPASGRIWQLNITNGNYIMHNVKDADLITIMTLAPDGKLWYIEPRPFGNDIGVVGVYNPNDNSTMQFKLPEAGIVTGITMDNNGSLWMPVLQANKVVKFDPKSEKFSSYNIPSPGAEPTVIMTASNGTIWFTEAIGKIAKIDVNTGKITEFAPKNKDQALGEPTAIFEDPKNPNTLYISEHTNHTVTAFNTLLGTFHRYPSPNTAGAPFGMTMDSYGNLWIAEHLIDRIAVMDPRTGESKEVKIPISGSFIQYLTTDNQGKVWFAAQRGQPSLGSITTTAKPSASPSTTNSSLGLQNATNASTALGVPQLGFSFAQVAGPGIAAGIVLSALFYTKSSIDLKRNIRAALKLQNS